MEARFDDELHLLAKALHQETFRFILIGHNRYSLYKDIAAWLRTTFMERPFWELRLRGKDYRQITDELLAFRHGIVLIPDFDWLLQAGNEATCVAFNQRRDVFARQNIALICFVEPANYPRIPEKVPDWWSLRSLELDFHRETADINLEFLPANEETSSLGGETKQEKEAEINRLIRQVDRVNENNKSLLRFLYDQIGMLSLQVSAYEAANKYWKSSLIISQEIGDKKWEARTLNNIAQIYDAQGDYETTLEYLQRSLTIRQQIGDKSGEGIVLNNLGMLAYDLGDYETALNYLQQSLIIKQQFADRIGEVKVRNKIAQIYRNTKDYETALIYLQQSLDISQQLGDNREEGVTFNNIAQIYRDRGDYKAATFFLKQSLGISQKIGDGERERTTLNNLGTIAYALSEYETALTYFRQSLSIKKNTGNKIVDGVTLDNIAHIYKEQGNYEMALTYLRQSLNVQQEIGNPAALATTMFNIGTIYFEQFQNFNEAVGFFFRSFELFLRINSPDAIYAQEYLDTIQNQIGQERFNQILQSVSA